jgi:hypothetical protein
MGSIRQNNKVRGHRGSARLTDDSKKAFNDRNWAKSGCSPLIICTYSYQYDSNLRPAYRPAPMAVAPPGIVLQPVITASRHGIAMTGCTRQGTRHAAATHRQSTT